MAHNQQDERTGNAGQDHGADSDHPGDEQVQRGGICRYRRQVYNHKGDHRTHDQPNDGAHRPFNLGADGQN